MKIWVPDRIVGGSPSSIRENNPIDNTVRKTGKLTN